MAQHQRLQEQRVDETFSYHARIAEHWDAVDEYQVFVPVTMAALALGGALCGWSALAPVWMGALGGWLLSSLVTASALAWKE